jgi:hypothetical protein
VQEATRSSTAQASVVLDPPHGRRQHVAGAVQGGAGVFDVAQIPSVFAQLQQRAVVFPRGQLSGQPLTSISSRATRTFICGSPIMLPFPAGTRDEM